MHAAPPGAMVAVALGPDDIAEHLSPGLDIAAVNDPGSCVIAGSAEDDPRVHRIGLPQQGIWPAGCGPRTRSIRSSMDPVLAGVRRVPVAA